MNAGQPKLSVKERDGPPQFIGVFAHLPVLLPPERRDESHFNRQKLEIRRCSPKINMFSLMYWFDLRLHKFFLTQTQLYYSYKILIDVPVCT